MAYIMRQHNQTFKIPEIEGGEFRFESVAEIEKHEIDYRRRVLRAGQQIEEEDWNQCFHNMPTEEDWDQCYRDAPYRSLSMRTWFFLFWRLQFAACEALNSQASLNSLYGLQREYQWSIPEIDDQLQLLAPLLETEMDEADNLPEIDRLFAKQRAIPDRNMFTQISFGDGEVTVQRYVEGETDAEKKIFQRLSTQTASVLPGLTRFMTLHQALIRVVTFKAMGDVCSWIFQEEDPDKRYKPDMDKVQRTRKQALNSSLMAAMSAHSYAVQLLLKAMASPDEDRRFTVARTMSLLSLATNQRLKKALQAEHRGNLRRALQYEVEASPEIEFRSWSEFSALHSRIARRLVKELSPETARMMELEPTTRAALLDLSQGSLNPLADFESVETAKQLAASLPSRQGEVFWRTFQGQSDQEIATQFGLSPVTVRRHLQAARTKLQQDF